MNTESRNESVGVGTTAPQDVKVNLDPETLRKIMKDYKKLKRYMKSPLYQIKKMDGKEEVISKLMEELEGMQHTKIELFLPYIREKNPANFLVLKVFLKCIKEYTYTCLYIITVLVLTHTFDLRVASKSRNGAFIP